MSIGTNVNSEMDKVWLITGTCGMDGSNFVDLLLSKGYTNIHGTMRRSATFNTANIEHVFDKIQLHYCDLTDAMNVHRIISNVKPHYIVNFAAQSHVKVSHDLEHYTMMTNTMGVLNILQSVRALGMEKTCRIYQAGTSEEFGNMSDGSVLLNEESSKVPVSIYGVSKLAAEHLCNIYRDAFGMFVVCGTLFNHEGSRRGGIFVTKKITNHVAKYIKHRRMISNTKKGSFPPLQLGNLNARRDWGSSEDYCQSVYLMLTRETPQNYVIATGETHSVREFVELAFQHVNIVVEWVGSGIYEKGINQETGEVLVIVNPKYYRDIDIHCLIGDSSKAQCELGWKPTVSFQKLVSTMVDSSVKKS